MNLTVWFADLCHAAVHVSESIQRNSVQGSQLLLAAATMVVVTDDKDGAYCDSERLFQHRYRRRQHETKLLRYLGNPTERTYDEYIEYIDKLPIEVPPEVFGMHENAKDQRQNATTVFQFNPANPEGRGWRRCCWRWRRCQRRWRGTGKEVICQDDISLILLTPCQFKAIWHGTGWAQVSCAVGSINEHCSMPRTWRFNNWMASSKVARQSKGCKGLQVSELRSLATSCTTQRFHLYGMPRLSITVPPAPMLLTFWSGSHFQKWLYNEVPPKTYTKFPLSAFLTGTLQNFARRHTVPIDEVKFDFARMTESWDSYNNLMTVPTYTGYLLMEPGGTWQINCLQSRNRKSSSRRLRYLLELEQQDNVVNTPLCLPCIQNKWAARHAIHNRSLDKLCYDDRLPSDRTEDFWVLQGIAMLTQLDQ